MEDGEAMNGLACKPQGLSYVFPQGWHIVCHAFSGWEAQKDSRHLFAKTESELYHLVVESEKRRGHDIRHKRRRSA